MEITQTVILFGIFIAILIYMIINRICNLIETKIETKNNELPFTFRNFDEFCEFVDILNDIRLKIEGGNK